MIERDALVGKVSNHHALFARAVVVRGIDAHAGARSAGLTKSNTRDHGVIGERAVTIVSIEFVWLGVIRDKQIHPAVVVIIEQSDTECLACRVVYARLCSDVLERAVAAIVKQRRALAFVGLRGAVRLVLAVERAVLIGLHGPLNVVADKKIELAVVVVVEPRSAG